MIMYEEIRIISSRTYDCANQSIFEESTLIHVYISIHFMTTMWKYFIKFHKLRSSSKTIAGRQAISENPIPLEKGKKLSYSSLTKIVSLLVMNDLLCLAPLPKARVLASLCQHLSLCHSLFLQIFILLVSFFIL